MNKERRICILLAHKDDEDETLLYRFLKKYPEPLELSPVHTVKDAIGRIGRHCHDLCLLELDLPGMKDLHVLRKLLDTGKGIPFIVITGQGDEKRALRAIKLGACDYLMREKISPPLLHQCIRHALREQSHRRELDRMQEELALYMGHLDEIVKERMEEEVRRSEDRFRSTLDSMIEGCQIIDFDWRYLYLNDSAVRHGRQRKEEMLGHTMMEMYPGIDKTEMFSHLRRCMEVRTSHNMVNEFTFPDGSIGWFQLSIQPVPEGVFILSFDITERRQMEAELIEKRRLAALGEMSAHIAHEIRNPLNSIGLSYQILLDSPNVRGRDRDVLDELGKGVDELTTISLDLLDYGRSDSLNLKTANPEDIVERALAECDEIVKKKEIEVTLRFHDTASPIKLDSVKIQRALSNAITNAVQSMSKKGKLSVSTEKSDGTLQIAISDTGSGIGAEHIEKIFTPFFTLKDRGTGLGMAILKRFVELHGGEVTVESEVGKGTTVTVCLPCR